MSEWTIEAVEQIARLTKVDAEYRQLLKECRNAEAAYQIVKQKLTEEEILVVEDYIALREELEYRYAQLAYQCGIGRGYVMALGMEQGKG